MKKRHCTYLHCVGKDREDGAEERWSYWIKSRDDTINQETLYRWYNRWATAELARTPRRLSSARSFCAGNPINHSTQGGPPYFHSSLPVAHRRNRNNSNRVLYFSSTSCTANRIEKKKTKKKKRKWWKNIPKGCRVRGEFRHRMTIDSSGSWNKLVECRRLLFHQCGVRCNRHPEEKELRLLFW